MQHWRAACTSICHIARDTSIRRIITKCYRAHFVGTLLHCVCASPCASERRRSLHQSQACRDRSAIQAQAQRPTRNHRKPARARAAAPIRRAPWRPIAGRSSRPNSCRRHGASHRSAARRSAAPHRIVVARSCAMVADRQCRRTASRCHQPPEAMEGRRTRMAPQAAGHRSPGTEDHDHRRMRRVQGRTRQTPTRASQGTRARQAQGQRRKASSPIPRRPRDQPRKAMDRCRHQPPHLVQAPQRWHGWHKSVTSNIPYWCARTCATLAIEPAEHHASMMQEAADCCSACGNGHSIQQNARARCSYPMTTV